MVNNNLPPEGRLRRRRRRKKQESESFRHKSFLSARLMNSWLEQLAARCALDIMIWEICMEIVVGEYLDQRCKYYEGSREIPRATQSHVMCRYPQEMQLGNIGTTGEGRDIKVE